MNKQKIVKNLAYSAILLKKGKHLSGHCGGGQRKQAPCDGLLISFSTAEHEKNAENLAFQDAVFLPLSLIPGMEVLSVEVGKEPKGFIFEMPYSIEETLKAFNKLVGLPNKRGKKKGK